MGTAMRRLAMALVIAVALTVVPAASGGPYNMPLRKGERAIRHAARRIAENKRNGFKSWSVYGCHRVRHSHVSCTGKWRIYAATACFATMIAYYPNSSPRIKVYERAWHCPR